MINEVATLRQEVADLRALVSRLFAVGQVVENDPETHRVKVRLPGHDNTLSDWLPVLVPRALGDKAYWLPQVREQVYCLFLPVGGLEAGAVLGASYHRNAPPPAANADIWRHEFADGAHIEYNRATHTMIINSTGELFIKSGGDLWIDAPHVHMFER